jgi:ribose 5-phosphate isomerase B
MTGSSMPAAHRPLRVVIAADHNGVALKSHLVAVLSGLGHIVDDRGTSGTEVVDYPVLCAEVCRDVVGDRADRGVVIGGSGQGEHIACNKFRGIRAGLCNSMFDVGISRAHNDSNVLVLAAKVISHELAEDLITAWLSTPFKGGIHQQRLDQIAVLEAGGELD